MLGVKDGMINEVRCSSVGENDPAADCSQQITGISQSISKPDNPMNVEFKRRYKVKARATSSAQQYQRFGRLNGP